MEFSAIIPKICIHFVETTFEAILMVFCCFCFIIYLFIYLRSRGAIANRQTDIKLMTNY